MFHGAGHGINILNRAHTGIEIQFLSNCYIKTSDSLADRCGHWPLNGHHMFFNCSQSFIRQPGAGLLKTLFPGQHLEPVDFSLAVVCLFNGTVHHQLGRPPDIRSDAIAFDKGNDRVVGHIQGTVGIFYYYSFICHFFNFLPSLYVKHKAECRCFQSRRHRLQCPTLR